MLRMVAPGVAGFLIGFFFGMSICRDGLDSNAQIDVTDVDPEILSGLASIAPSEGSGAKEYYYGDGALKEVVEWESYLPVRTTYYDKSRQVLFRSELNSESEAWHIALNENGGVIEVYLTRGFIRHGVSFSIADSVNQFVVRHFEHGEEVTKRNWNERGLKKSPKDEIVPKRDNYPRD